MSSVRHRERRVAGSSQAGVAVNVPTTMALTFVVSMGAQLALAGVTLNQAIVAGAVATYGNQGLPTRPRLKGRSRSRQENRYVYRD